MTKTKLPNIISVLILTLITVVMWVSFEIYRAIKRPIPSTIPLEVSQTLTSSFDQKAIEQINSRIFLDDSQIPEGIINSTTSSATIQ